MTAAPPRIAVVGTGMAGLTAGWLLARSGFPVVLLERAPRLGMAAHGIALPTGDGEGRVDVPVRAFNPRLWRNLLAFADELGLHTNAVGLESSYSDLTGRTWLCFRELNLGQDRSMPVPDQGRLLAPRVARSIASLWRLRRRAEKDLEGGDRAEQPLGAWLASAGFGDHFVQQFVCPVLALMLSCPHEAVLGYPAVVVLGALPMLFGEVSFRRFGGGTAAVTRRIARDLDSVRCGVSVQGIEHDGDGVVVRTGDGQERFDHVIVATQANQASPMLVSAGDRAVLDRFPYATSQVVVHTDPRFLPRERSDWSAVNFATAPDGADSMGTIWVNRIEPLLADADPVFQTWNPLYDPQPDRELFRVTLQRPLVTADSVGALADLAALHRQPDRRVWYCGSYAAEGIPLLESAVLSSMRVAQALGATIPWSVAP